VGAGVVVAHWDNVWPIYVAISNNEVIMITIATKFYTNILKWSGWSILAYERFSRVGW